MAYKMAMVKELPLENLASLLVAFTRAAEDTADILLIVAALGLAAHGHVDTVVKAAEEMVAIL